MINSETDPILEREAEVAGANVLESFVVVVVVVDAEKHHRFGEIPDFWRPIFRFGGRSSVIGGDRRDREPDELLKIQLGVAPLHGSRRGLVRNSIVSEFVVHRRRRRRRLWRSEISSGRRKEGRKEGSK